MKHRFMTSGERRPRSDGLAGEDRAAAINQIHGDADMQSRLNFIVASTAFLAIVWAAPARGAETPTFAADVAPILYAECASCHRPGDIAPMALLTYRDVRPWSRAIKAKVVSREMPPWHAAPGGVPIRNARGLTQD